MKRDVNGDTANISEEIVSEPFDQQNLFLQPGVHLHWALPDALTKGTHTPDRTIFPAVPNRWLITRSRKEGKEASPPGSVGEDVKRWVVESDYLFPDGQGDLSGSVCIPVEAGSGRPFRFLGRSLPLDKWLATRNGGDEHLEKLTAIGYGDPTFAAFYPNCRSVFGFLDNDFTNTLDSISELQYDVVGWYDRCSDDPLASLASSLEEALGWTAADFTVADREHRLKLSGAKAGKTVRQVDTGVLYEITDETQLADENGYAAVPNLRMVCYSRLNIDTKLSKTTDSAGSAGNCVQVAVGNTGTEALSALLASLVADAGSSSRKETIEDQLEALSLSARLGQRQLDVGPKFEEARHAKGFSAVAGGAIWSVLPRRSGTTTADAATASGQIQATLPEDLAKVLSRLNHLQQEFDRAQREIESMRTQLFADWYKYMLCAYPPTGSRDSYPDIDEVRNYIERDGIGPLQRKIRATGVLLIESTAEGTVRAVDTDASPGSLAMQLADAVRAVQDRLIESNAKAKAAAEKKAEEEKKADEEKKDEAPYVSYMLKQIPGPRFYEPNDPVVLVTGDAVTPLLRHGNDGRLDSDGMLKCHLLTGVDSNLFATDKGQAAIEGIFDRISGKIDTIAAEAADSKKEAIGISRWSNQPWNPILLEWEVEVFPIKEKSNVNPQTCRYEPDFITENYKLDENEVDVRMDTATDAAIAKAANVYVGTSILTPHAGTSLKGQIDDYVLERYYEDKKIPISERTIGYFSRNRDAIASWTEETLKPLAATDGSPGQITYNMVLCREKLKDLHCLSQALGGFNEALLMHKQTFQLRIADPLGFDDYSGFSDTVQALVADCGIRAAQPLSDFNPIRSGAMQLLRLRLVDTFGQMRDLHFDQVVTTEQLKVPGSPHEISLPPRLSQAARLNFRWLSADDDEQEMNDLPATSPICGWVVPNNLDNSLMIYDSTGKAMGSINGDDGWESAPGGGAVEILNRHLKNVVATIQGLGLEFLQSFISVIDTALENIEPESFAQHQDIALLMGRPIAVVRASLDLELAGLPAVHQGWDFFRQDFRKITRHTAGFERVEFPIRLGEYQQFNDGLVGYWKDDADDNEAKIFYAPQSEESPLFTQRDFLKPSQLAKRLLPRDESTGKPTGDPDDQPAQYLARTLTFSEEVRKTLLDDDELAIAEVLTNAFNSILRRGESIFDLSKFESIRFSDRTTQKLREKPDGEERLWLHRWLLEDAYPGLVSRTERYSKDHDFIKTHTDDDSLILTQPLAAAPQRLTMLVDPRGKVHAICGILPVKEITIPPDQFTDALKAIEVTFHSRPILTDLRKIRLPLPVEPGYQWSWLQRDGDDWTEIVSPGVVRKKDFLDAFATEGAAVWKRLGENGSIEIANDDLTATILPLDKRKDLPALGADILAEIVRIFDRAEIGTVSSSAVFSGPQAIREGWLKLKLAETT